MLTRVPSFKKCAPRLGRKHNFANFTIVPSSTQHSFCASRSSPLVRNENHENQLGGDFWSAGRNAEIWGGSEMRLKTSALDLTRQRLPCGKGGGFNRYAHSAGPILNTLFYSICDPHQQLIDMVIWSRTHYSKLNLVRLRQKLNNLEFRQMFIFWESLGVIWIDSISLGVIRHFRFHWYFFKFLWNCHFC